MTPEHVVRLEAPSLVDFVQADPRDAHRMRVFADSDVYEVSWTAGASGEPTAAPTWTLRAPPKSYFWHTGASDPRDWDHILLVPEIRAQVEMSRDGGRSWRRSSGPMPRITALVLAEGGGQAWAFGSEISKSEDGGETFHKVADAPAGTLALAGTADTVAELVGTNGDSPFVMRLDLQTGRLSTQPLPAGASRSQPSFQVLQATLVPGEPAALCIGITEMDLSGLNRM